MSAFRSTTVRWCAILTVIQVIILIVDCHRSVYGSNRTEFPENAHSDICLPFAPIPNGYIQFKQVKNHITAFPQCKDGFALKGASVIPCLFNSWVVQSDEEFPKCLKMCSPPPVLINGSVEIKKKPQDFASDLKSFADGTEAHYKCNEGYILDPVSSAVRNCTDGFWSGDDAMCKSSDCPFPPKIDNGFLHSEFLNLSEISIGQEVSYTCIQGYDMVGSDTVTCSKEGEWTPNAPTCISSNGK